MGALFPSLFPLFELELSRKESSCDVPGYSNNAALRGVFPLYFVLI